MSTEDLYETSWNEHAAAEAHAQNLSNQISDARNALIGDHSNEHVEHLSDLLRQRFFALGNPKDIDEFFALEETLPLVDPSTFAEPNVKAFNSELRTYEHKWVEWYPWLQSRGYALDARYNPSWVPSWQTSRRVRNRCADRYGAPVSHHSLQELGVLLMRFAAGPCHGGDPYCGWSASMVQALCGRRRQPP